MFCFSSALDVGLLARRLRQPVDFVLARLNAQVDSAVLALLTIVEGCKCRHRHWDASGQLVFRRRGESVMALHCLWIGHICHVMTRNVLLLQQARLQNPKKKMILRGSDLHHTIFTIRFNFRIPVNLSRSPPNLLRTGAPACCLAYCDGLV